MSENKVNEIKAPVEVLAIAKRQRGLLVVFVSFYLLAMLSSQIPEDFDLIILGVRVLLWIAMVAMMARLATKLYSLGMTILFCVLTVIPLINLIALIVVNQKASGVLKEAGFKVGLGGADVSEIEQSMSSHNQPPDA
jgi:hypothetical protein